MADRDIPEEKVTFWNERVGRVEPTREGQPLRWWYGPTKASSDPNQKWCDDCYGAVEEGDGRRWCRCCKASQPLLDAAMEAAADTVTRELAPTWVRYPVGIRSVPDLRVLIEQVLSAALAGRTVVVLPEPDEVYESGPEGRWYTRPDSDAALTAYLNANGTPEIVTADDDYWSPDDLERDGLIRIAAARYARGLAAGSGSGEG